MSEETTTDHAPPRRTPRQTARDVGNPATVKGAIAVVAGLAVLVIPDASLSVIEWAAGAALIAVGGYDLWFALTGRGERDRGSRWLALGRGTASMFIGALILWAPSDTLTFLVVVLGIYLIVRGLLSVIAAPFTSDRSRRASRYTIGAGGVAFGVLALAVPSSLVEGLVVSAAVGALVVGGILLAYGLRVGAPASRAVEVTAASTPEILWDWVRTTDVGAARRDALAETLYFENPGRPAKLVAWWVMLLLSVAIATFAILQDSTAVVIGAMLIAPLMTPILGLAGALINGWRHRAGASSLLVASGAVGSVGLAYLIASWVPALTSFDSNTQIISRVSPTFLDMLIALCAGAAGAFATVNSRVASSIAGVAIAVALVPPLGVVGVSLEAQRWDDAVGSLVLFMTNFVSIVLAAAAVFVLAGFAESSRLRSKRKEVASTLAPFGSLALVILVPLVFTAEGILATATQQRQAQDTVADWLGDDSGVRVTQVVVDNDEVTVNMAGTEAIPPPRRLQDDLSEALDRDVTLIIEYTPTAKVTIDDAGRVERSGTAPGEQATPLVQGP
ncbi:MAG: DUF389 domain-containing protein [Jiangellales bacterium]